jgi:hypothetical protein
MPNSPFSYKPGGFMNGAGHGSTVMGPYDQYWHFASMAVSVNVNWERRICMYPLWFDGDGLMHSDTRFGDYPHVAPAVPGAQGAFKGWMLLSYKKPVKASSVLEEFDPKNINDENVKTFWVAQENDSKQWLEIDLENPGKVFGIQVNYHDHKSGLYGKIPGLHHRYYIEGSVDGKNWVMLVDRKNNFRDVPNDYVELATPQTVRYIRYRNIHVPTPYLSISGLRVFGTGQGKAPKEVKNFSVVRKDDRRDAMVKWDSQVNTQGYNVFWGIGPDKLYNTWQVYDKDFLELKNLSTDQVYYFAIEAFNDNGVSARSKPQKVE